MIAFWRSTTNADVHIANPRAEQVFCGQYAPTDPGWMAAGETIEFATCETCRRLCTAALFAASDRSQR